ncbi:HAD family hydrolase [Sinomonas halotolerans]|uniref:HAD family hydrolase n=1 Tax=Sinomonas halotolerans TaxID=1644133 RepID=A0ABU9WX00_9MICC
MQTDRADDGGGAPAVVPVPQTVRGVLLDIDETLVDLEGAMDRALREVTGPLLPGLGEEEWAAFCRIFTRGSDDIYAQYIAGAITFAQQRILRAERCLAHFGAEFESADHAVAWLSAYESAQPAYVAAFDDVVPFLDVLDSAGIAYGAVSNNVHDYQRAKLDHAGLDRVRTLVGIDAVGAAKPDPAIFHEGLRQLGTGASETVYVGDNPAHDVIGAAAAGLCGIWLNRREAVLAEDVAAAVPRQVASLAEVPALLGLG